MALARTPKVLLTAALAGLAVACGVPTVPAQEGAAALGAAGGSDPAAAGTLSFGSEHHFADGVTVSVGAPTSFAPSAAAYPQSPRAAAFDVEIDNDGTDAYKLSGLVVSAEAAKQPVKQLVDATQGYNGIPDAGKDLPPGRSVPQSAKIPSASWCRAIAWWEKAARSPAIIGG